MDPKNGRAMTTKTTLLLLLTLITLGSGQEQANVFFSLDESLNTLAGEVEALCDQGDEDRLLSRLNEFLYLMIAQPERGPVSLSKAHACSPWRFLGHIWGHLPEACRSAVRRQVTARLDRLAAGSDRYNRLASKACLALPDPALRRRYCPALAEAALEAGRFGEAARHFQLIRPPQTAAVQPPPSHGAIMASILSTPPGAPPPAEATGAGSGDLSEFTRMVLREQESMAAQVAWHHPFQPGRYNPAPGSLLQRFQDFTGGMAAGSKNPSGFSPIFPVVMQDMAYLFNGRSVLCVDLAQHAARWRRDLPGPHPRLRNTLLLPAAGQNRVYVSAGARIACLDAATGETLWCRQGHRDDDNAQWIQWREKAPAHQDEAIQLTPPLLAMGRLFMGAVFSNARETSAQLYAFSPDTGALLWQTQTGTTQTTDFLGLGLSPLPLAAHEGRIFFCPNMGFVAAVHGSDGATAFIKTYPRLTLLAEQASLENRSFWHIMPPVIRQSKVILAPQDAKAVIALDGRMGNLAFSIPKGEADYCIGPVDHQLFLIGRQLKAVSLAPSQMGQVLFETPLRARPQGYGQVVNKLLALPFRDTLVFFDTASGRVMATHLWEISGGGGNILATRHGLLVAGPKEIDQYRNLSEEQTEMQLRLASFHANIRALVESRYALKTMDFPKAIQSLAYYRDHANQYISPNETVERRERIHTGRLLDSWIQLPIDNETKLALCDYRADLAVNDQEAVNALVTQGGLHAGLGQWQAALDRYYAALARADTISMAVSWDLKAQAVPLIQGKIQDILTRVPRPDDLLVRYAREAAEELAFAKETLTIPVFLAIIRKYPFTPAAQEAVIDCARMYLASQNSAAARDLLTAYYHQNPDGLHAHTALSMLARIYEAGQDHGGALAMYRLLEKRFPQRTIPLGGRTVSVAGWVKKQMNSLPRPEGGAEADTLRLPLQLVWQTASDLLERTAGLSLVAPVGVAPPDCLLVHGSDYIRLRDTGTGLLKAVFKTPAYFQGAGFLQGPSGRVLVLAGRSALRGYRLKDKAVVLQVTLSKDDRPSSFLQAFDCVDDRVVYMAGDRMGCVNGEGKSLWETPIPDRCKAPFFLTPTRAAAFSVARGLVHFMDHRSGAKAPPLALPTGANRLNAPPVRTGPGTALAVYGNILCHVDILNMRLLWHRELEDFRPSGARHQAAHPDRMYLWGRVPAGRHRLQAVRLSDGGPLWHKTFQERMPVLALAADGRDHLIVLTGETLQFLTSLTHAGSPGEATQVWQKRLSKRYGAIQPFFVAGGSVFHANLINNQVLALSTRTGTIQNDGVQGVHSFLNKRLLLAAEVHQDALYILTENGLGCFRFHDPYRTNSTREALINGALNAGHDHAPFFQLGRHLLTRGDPDKALTLLNDVLWERWVAPGTPAPLWQLLGAAQEALVQKTPQVIPCYPAPRDMTIDGYLTEQWPLRSAIRLNRPANLAAVQRPDNPVPQWRGPEDLSALFLCAWDADNFYFAMKVRDNMVLPHDKNADEWIGDCLIISVDPNGNGGLFHGPDDLIFTLFLSVQQQNRGKGGGASRLQGEYKIRITGDRSGIIYEGAIPWSFLGREPLAADAKEPVVFGFNLIAVDDDDGHGSRQALSINGGHPLGWRVNQLWDAYIPSYSPKIMLKR